MFTQIAPQKVRHSSGYIVQIGSRHAVEYYDARCKASVEVEFGKPNAVYASTLTAGCLSGSPLNLLDTEKAEIIQRIVEGLRAMGSSAEIY